MDDAIDSWIKCHRMLRIGVKPDVFKYKRDTILSLYKTALRGRDIPATPYVYNSHQADIRQIPELNAIVCDVHFFDIARLVASSFYVSPTHDITRLANALLSNSLLCHGKVNLALEYAHKYIDGSYVAAFNAAIDEVLLHKVSSSMLMQTSFALLHEIAHFECDDSKNSLAKLFKKGLYDIIDNQNEISKCINDVDLTAIVPYLDKIDIKGALSFPPPENSPEILIGGVQQLYNVLLRYGHKIRTPGTSGKERIWLLLQACNNYLLGHKAQMLNREILVTEGTCDLLALFELLDYGLRDVDRIEALRLAIDAYTLSLLTLDLIQYAMNALKYANCNGYCYVDSIYMRRETERLLLPAIIGLYSITYDCCLSSDKIDMLSEHFSASTKICDVMYAEFCNYVSSQKFTELSFIPHGSTEWLRMYVKINQLLQYPV